MKKILLVLCLTGLVITGSGCGSTEKKNTKATETAKPKGKYYCPMHPNVSADKPGTCSKCGMDLVERDDAAGK